MQILQVPNTGAILILAVCEHVFVKLKSWKNSYDIVFSYLLNTTMIIFMSIFQNYLPSIFLSRFNI